MKIIKRSGSENEFDADKIVAAISKANTEVPTIERLSEEQICEIASNVEKICEDMHRALNVEEIQDLVEDQIMNKRAFTLARKYITYRYNRALVRKSNSTDKQILSLIECDNEEVMQENSNKNPTVNSVQRDYMAGKQRYYKTISAAGRYCKGTRAGYHPLPRFGLLCPAHA